MSHTSSSLRDSSMSDLISFPLAKFSWTTDPSKETSFAWRHTTQDVIVAFDSYRPGASGRSSLSSRMLKVVQGTAVLESVDIEEKAQQALTAIAHARKWNIQLKLDQVPTVALHRRSALTIAIRYILTEDTVRRTQLKFTAERDFQLAYDVLDSIGCPMYSSVPPQKPDVAGPACPPGSLAALHSRVEPPSSAYDPESASRTVSTMFSLPPSQPRGLDLQREAVRPRTMPAQQLTHGAPVTYNHHARESQTNRYEPPRRLHRSFTTSCGRPSTSSSIIDEQLHPTQSGGDQSRLVSYAGLLQGRQFYSGPAEAASAMPPPHKIASLENVRRSGTNTRSENRYVTSTLSESAVNQPQSVMRPSMAPAHPTEDSLTDLIPPRRELPFRRPSTARGTSMAEQDRDSSRPSSSMQPSPLPKPSFAATIARNAERSSSVTLAAEEQPQQRIIEKVNTSHATNTSGVSHVSQPYPDTLGRHELRSSSLQRSSSKRPLDEMAETGRSFLNITCTVQGESTASVPSTLPARSVQEMSSLEPVKDLPAADRTVRGSHDLLPNLPPTLAQWDYTANLRNWASLPHEEKMKTFNDLVVQCISDDNFLVFSEDVYNNWRRVALGS